MHACEFARRGGGARVWTHGSGRRRSSSFRASHSTSSLLHARARANAASHAPAYAYAYGQVEMRKSLWRPRFTPVTFSLLLTATSEVDELGYNAERVRYLPAVLQQMGSMGILPREETCDNLLAACIATGELGIGRQVLEVAGKAGHEIDPQRLTAFERALLSDATTEVPHPEAGSGPSSLDDSGTHSSSEEASGLRDSHSASDASNPSCAAGGEGASAAAEAPSADAADRGCEKQKG